MMNLMGWYKSYQSKQSTINIDTLYHCATYQIPDTSCEVVDCTYCKTKGVIFTKTLNEESHVEQHLQSPCPVCLGKLKAGKDGCRYYADKVETVNFVIPPGSRLGHQSRFSQYGACSTCQRERVCV